MRIIVAITAASGAIYARQVLEILVSSDEVEQIGVIWSRNARAVAEFERVSMPESGKITEYGNDDMFASPASGSSRWDAMIVVPCTVGTMARIAHGESRSLIERCADVILKERRRMVIVLRENPLSIIHIRNMETLTSAGAIIMPAAPSFYSHPQGIEELCRTVSSHAVELLGVESDRPRWDSAVRPSVHDGD